MAFIPDEQIEQIRNRVDIVQLIGEAIQLKRAGRNFKGLCPFHGEKTPSFMVSPDKQIYHCFGCGEGGNAFSFLMKFQGLDFVEAAKKLADRCGITLTLEERGGKPSTDTKEKDVLFKIQRLAAKYYFETLWNSEAGKRGREFLKRRGITDGTARRFGLGLAEPSGQKLWEHLRSQGISPEWADKAGLVRTSGGRVFDFFRDRLIFPIFGGEKTVIGFGGRVLTADVEGAKFINSPDTPIYNKRINLYGYSDARQAIREKGFAIIVEGYIDLIMMAQHGFENVVAPLGTALTSEQLRLISRQTRRICVIFDSDTAGEKASDRALDLGLEEGFAMETAVLPDGEDPDSFLRKHGAEVLKGLIDKRTSLFESLIERYVTRSEPTTLGKTAVVKELIPFFGKVSNDVERSLYTKTLAEVLGVDEGALLREIYASSRKQSGFQDQKRLATFGGIAPIKDLPVIEKTILELLLGAENPPLNIIKEVREEDFANDQLRLFWGWLCEKIEFAGKVDVAGLAGEAPNSEFRALIGRLSVLSERYDSGDVEKIAEDCLKKMRERRLKGRLKRLTSEIEAAEKIKNEGTLVKLLQEKNELVKLINL